jgi:NAD+ kinase
MTAHRNNIYLFYKKNEKILANLSSLHELAEQNGFNIVSTMKEANIIAALGGDGTFLQAVRKSGFRDDCLYAGVTLDEQPSFYCDFNIDEKEKMVEAMTNADIEVRRFPIIEVKVDQNPSFYCLNECTIRSSVIKTLTADVYINDLHFETFRGDGIVIATPTGSTAYNKSINGAVVDPLMDCMQISEIASLNNNTYRTLGSSFILSEQNSLTLRLGSYQNLNPIVGVDNEALNIQQLEKIEVKLHHQKIKTVKLKDNSFWRRVQRTFL